MLDVFDYWEKHNGIEPEFVLRTPVGTLARELQKRRWTYHALDYSFWVERNPPLNMGEVIRHAVQNQNAILAIEGIIQSTRPDVVMTNSIVCPWAALAAYSRNVPHVWFVREYADLHFGWKFQIGRKDTYEDVDRLSALVVTNSRSLADHVSKYVNKGKVITLYNPFDIPELRRRAAQAVTNPFLGSNSLKVVMTGTLVPSKRQHEVISAVDLLMKEGYDVELCLIGRAGDKKYQISLAEAVREGGLGGKVHFAGEQANPLAFASLADVCVIASRMEAFGRVTFEYLAVGKPVVGANSGATPELVQPENNGYLYESGDVNSLVTALRHYAQDKELARRHGAASAAMAERLMKSPENIATLYRRISEMLKRPAIRAEAPIRYLQHLENIRSPGSETRRKARINAKEIALEDMYALNIMQPLLTGQYLPFSSSSLRTLGMALLLNDIVLNSRRNILEFGSGLSSILVGRLIQRNSLKATLVTVEHDAAWIEVLQKIISEEDLDAHVSVIHAALTDCDIALNGAHWYDASSLEQHLSGRTIDMVIVDGPPAWEEAKRKARYPALPYAYRTLSENAMVFLDDADRLGEQWILKKWEGEFGLRFKMLGPTCAYAMKGKGLDPGLFD